MIQDLEGGTTPAAHSDNNTYTNLSNPGYITDSSNLDQLIHVVGYWKHGTYFDRGVIY